MVLSFSSAAEAMMFSVGWQAVEMTTSAERKTKVRQFTPGCSGRGDSDLGLPV